MSAEDFPSHITDDDLAAARQWWDSMVRNADGTLNERNVYAELSDFKHMIDEVPKVYSHVTCGLMSKPNYYAVDVISQANECDERYIRLAILEVLDRIEAGETINDLRDEHTNPDD